MITGTLFLVKGTAMLKGIIGILFILHPNGYVFEHHISSFNSMIECSEGIAKADEILKKSEEYSGFSAVGICVPAEDIK